MDKDFLDKSIEHGGGHGVKIPALVNHGNKFSDRLPALILTLNGLLQPADPMKIVASKIPSPLSRSYVSMPNWSSISLAKSASQRTTGSMGGRISSCINALFLHTRMADPAVSPASAENDFPAPAPRLLPCDISSCIPSPPLPLIVSCFWRLWGHFVNRPILRRVFKAISPKQAKGRLYRAGPDLLVSVYFLCNLRINANSYEFFGYVITEMQYRRLHIYHKSSHTLKPP